MSENKLSKPIGNLEEFRKHAKDEIMKFLDLPHDWDGYGGIPPKKQTVDDAWSIFDKLCYFMPVEIGVAGDGEIGLFYRQDEAYFNIACYGEGFYSYYGKFNDIEFFGDDLLVEKFPDDSFNELLLMLIK